MSIISIITTFIITFLCHFIYNWFPNPLFAVVFPVNESVWEHMKMIYTSILLNGIVEYILIKIYQIKVKNLLITIYLKAVSAIPICLFIFLPFFYLIGDNLYIAIASMLISIIVTNLMGNLLLNKKEIPNERIISLTLIILTYMLMTLLTYNPPHEPLFYDTKSNQYGLVNSINN